MLKKLIKKLVTAGKARQLAHKKLLRQQHNDEVIKSILKDLDERAYQPLSPLNYILKFKKSQGGEKMNERILNISFNKSGRGTYTPKLALPMAIVRDMGISKEDREIKLLYNEETKEITIKKNKKI